MYMRRVSFFIESVSQMKQNIKLSILTEMEDR